MFIGRHDLTIQEGGVIEIPASWRSELFGTANRVCLHLHRPLKCIELISLAEMTKSFSGLLREDRNQDDLKMVSAIDGKSIQIPEYFLTESGIAEKVAVVGEVKCLHAGNPDTIHYEKKSIDAIVRSQLG